MALVSGEAEGGCQIVGRVEYCVLRQSDREAFNEERHECDVLLLLERFAEGALRFDELHTKLVTSTSSCRYKCGILLDSVIDFCIPFWKSLIFIVWLGWGALLALGLGGELFGKD